MCFQSIVPQKLPVGAPLPVTGTTTLPVGTTFDLSFSSSGQTSNQISSIPVTVGDDKGFNTVFETTGLKGGMYKVEAIPRGDYQDKLSSDSTTIKVVELVDRSDMLHITSPDQPGRSECPPCRRVYLESR